MKYRTAPFLALLSAIFVVPEGLIAKAYNVEKPESDKFGNSRPLIFQPDNDFQDYRAFWTYSLKGFAANSRQEIDSKTVIRNKVEISFTDSKDQNVAVAWASGFMRSHAQWEAATDLLGERIPNGWSAKVAVDGTAIVDLKLGPKPKNKDWAFVVSSSTSQLIVEGKTVGMGIWKVVPNVKLTAAGCTKVGDGKLPDGIIPPEFAALANNCKVADPLSFVAVNLDTGEELSGQLMDWQLDALSDRGILAFSDDHLIVKMSNGRFWLEIPGIYTVQQGSIEFEFADGVVTRSVATGMFNGILPGVGESAYGRFKLGLGPLRYDFGWGSSPYDVTFSSTVIGSISSYAEVPEPESWAMLLVGFGLVGCAIRRRSRIYGQSSPIDPTEVSQRTVRSLPPVASV